MDILLLVLRLALAAVFLLAGIGKLLDLEGSGKALLDFGVPRSFAGLFAVVLPLFEILVAVSLIFVGISWFGAIAAAALLTVFSAGMMWQIRKGNAPDCHCFGQIHNEPVSVKSLLRNVVFIILAVPLVGAGSGFQGYDILAAGQGNASFGVMQIIIGLAVVGLLIAITILLKTISDQQTKILRRIEVLELISNEGRDVERDDVTHPNEGLPIGSPVPEFSVSSLAGDTLGISDLLSAGRPLLVVFVSPACHPCESLMPDFERWVSEYSDEIGIAFISRGDLDENREKFGGEIAEHLYIQEGFEVSGQFGARWTPTAVLVSADGKVASHNAVGDVGIRELLEKVANADLDREFVFFVNGEDTEPPMIGEEIPEFSLKSLGGEEVSSEMLRGRRTLATFWSTSCPYCVEMIEQLRDWDNAKGVDDPDLLIFSEGDEDDHEGFGLVSPILIDDGHKTSEKLGMNGTPSAVLINEEGKFISETAVGAARIWALIGRRFEPGGATGEN